MPLNVSTAWRDAASPVELNPTDRSEVPATLQIDVGTGGNVQLQIEDRAGAWVNLDGDEFNFSENGLHTLVRANMPAIRIFASGDAQFIYTGDQQ